MVGFESRHVYSQDRGAVSVDQGLRSYMVRVYNYMFLGLFLTGITSFWAFAKSFTDRVELAALGKEGPMEFASDLYFTPLGVSLFMSPFMLVLIIGTLGVCFLFNIFAHRLSLFAVQAMFWLYAVMMGLLSTPLFASFTGSSIFQVFLLTSLAFGGLSLLGYQTKKDLSPLGSFLFMGLIGLIGASILNIFIASSIFEFGLSIFGVLLFSGMTVYDVQRLKQLYYQQGGEVDQRQAIVGAMTLYVDFINLLYLLLQLLGKRRME